MQDKQKKIVIGVRVYEQVKTELQKQANQNDQTLSNFINELLTQQCEKKEMKAVREATVAINQQTFEQLEESKKLMKLENLRLEKVIQDLMQKDDQAKVLELKAKLKQYMAQLKERDEYIDQLKERLENEVRAEPVHEKGLKLANKERFDRQIAKLQHQYPKLTKDELMELAISCTLHNETHFFIHNLRQHLNRKPNFFKPK